MGFIEVYDLEINNSRFPQLVKIKNTEINEKLKINNVDNAVDIIESTFKASKKAEEYLYMLSIDSRGKVNAAFIISKGNINSTMLNMKGIFIRALLSGANGIILAHNHPSGEAYVSKEDRESLKEVWKLCQLMELDFMDYLVIGNDCYVSTLDLINELKNGINARKV